MPRIPSINPFWLGISHRLKTNQKKPRRGFGQATVFVVHHCGKNKGAVERGSTALRAAVDFSIEISKDDDIVSVQGIKTKDELPTHYLLKLVSDETHNTLVCELCDSGPKYSTEQLILNLLPELDGSKVTAESGLTVNRISIEIDKSNAVVAAKLKQLCDDVATTHVCKKKLPSGKAGGRPVEVYWKESPLC